MQRRKLLATAGVLSATAFATTVCLGANLGLFGLTEPDSPVGHLAPQPAQQPSIGPGRYVATTVVVPSTTVLVPATTVPFPRNADD